MRIAMEYSEFFNKTTVSGVPIREDVLLIIYIILTIFVSVMLEINGLTNTKSSSQVWLFMHLLFYVILGFLYPRQIQRYLIISILWEYIEVVGGGGWADDALEDILTNLIGYLVGWLFAEIVDLTALSKIIRRKPNNYFNI